jgi:RHS repeat-associated protein
VLWTDGTNTDSYAYDGDGNRLSKTTNGQTIRYVNDMSDGLTRVLLETDAANALKRHYSYGYGLASQSDVGGVSYYLYDKPGRSVVEIEKDGNIAYARYRYSAFGIPKKYGSIANAYQYTGEQYDEITGLLYLRNRYYDPEMGRFISRDAFPGFMERPQSLNNYAYVENNPETHTDPNGDYGIAGACVGALVDVGIQLYQNGGNIYDINYYQVAGSALLGAVGQIGLGRAYGAARGYLGSTVTKGVKELTTQQQKAIRSLEKQIAKHEKKIQDFKDNPTVRPGMENLPKEVIQKQQQRRIQHLETEINTFKNNIDKIKQGEIDS